jgi:hypothetical protein
MSTSALADIARMQSQKMWDAFGELDQHRREQEHLAAKSGNGKTEVGLADSSQQ